MDSQAPKRPEDGEKMRAAVLRGAWGTSIKKANIFRDGLGGELRGAEDSKIRNDLTSSAVR
jgi:hypothetical protein